MGAGRLRPLDEVLDELNLRGRNDWTNRSLVERAKNRQIPAVKISGHWGFYEEDLEKILTALPERQAVR